jgi:hypothetical protein
MLLYVLMETNKKKSRAIAGAAFVNRDQVLGGGCNWEPLIYVDTTTFSGI